MSALSMQKSPATVHDRFAAVQSAGAVPPQSSTEILLAASQIQPGERVKVIGTNAVPHLIALAGSGCGSATSVHPDSVFFQREAADVVWITAIDDVETRMAGALRNIGTPRVVAIELLAANTSDRLSPFIRQLMAKGLVTCSTHETADRLIFIASRPNWLRKVI